MSETQIIADSTPTFLVTLPAPPANAAFPGDVVEILDHDTGEVLETYVLTAVDTTRRSAMVTVLPALADGVYSFSARLRRNGAVSASSEVDVVRIDTQAPAAPSLALHPDDDKGGGTVVQPRPRFIVGLPPTAEAGDSAALWFDDLQDPGVVLGAGDIAAGQVEIQAAAALPVGLHVAYARVTDRAGNEGAASNVVGFELTAFAAGVASGGAPGGTLTVETSLRAGIAAASTPAGDLHVADQVALAGGIAASGAPAGAATVEKPVAATPASTAAPAGQLAVEKPLSAALGSAGAPAGDLGVSTAQALEAGVASAAAPGGALSVEKPLAAAGASASTPAGDTTVEKRLSAALESAGEVAADLGTATAIPIEAAIEAAGIPAAAVRVEKPVASAAASASAPAGGITVGKSLAAGIASSGAPSGDLHVATPALLAAAAASAGAPAGGLTVEKPLTAAIASAAAPAGDLAVAAAIAATVAVASAPAGALSVDRAMAAGVASAATPGAAAVDAVAFAVPTASAIRWGNPGPSGGADSDKATIVAWYRLRKLSSALGQPQSVFNIEMGNATDSLQLIVDTDDRLKLRSWNNGAAISLLATVAETLDGAWHCAMASFDGDLANGGVNAVTHLHRDGEDVLAGGASAPVVLPDLTRPMKIGGRTSASNTWPYTGELALFWYDHGIALDFSLPAVRAAFLAGGHFVPVGANGERPTGTPPRICLQGGAAAFRDNVGLGSDPIDQIGAGLVDAAGPQDAESGLTVTQGLVAALAAAAAPAGALTVEKPLAAALAAASAPAGLLDAFSDDIRAVEYDGGGDFLVYEAATHGAADGPAIAVAGALKSTLDAVEQVLFAWGGAVPGALKKNADNSFSFTGGDAGAVFSVVTAAVPASVGDCIVLADADGTAAHLYVIHAGGVVTGVNTPGAAATLTLATDWHFGESAAGGARLDAAVAMWWVRAAALDFSVADNREQFWDSTAHKLRNPGPAGANPLDGAGVPNVFNIEPAASHGESADSAGTFEDGVSPGAYADDFVPSAAAASIAYVPGSAAGDATNGASYTFTDHGIGADVGGHLLVECHARYAGSAAVHASCTVGGEAATLVGRANGDGGSTSASVSLWIIESPEGVDTATIAFAAGATALTGSIAVSRLTDADPAPHDVQEISATGLSDPFSLGTTLDVPDAGAAIGAASGYAGGPVAWTGLDKDYDTSEETNLIYSGASRNYETGGETTAVEAAFGTPNAAKAAVYASFGPATP